MNLDFRAPIASIYINGAPDESSPYFDARAVLLVGALRILRLSDPVRGWAHTWGFDVQLNLTPDAAAVEGRIASDPVVCFDRLPQGAAVQDDQKAATEALRAAVIRAWEDSMRWRYRQ